MWHQVCNINLACLSIGSAILVQNLQLQHCWASKVCCDVDVASNEELIYVLFNRGEWDSKFCNVLIIWDWLLQRKPISYQILNRDDVIYQLFRYNIYLHRYNRVSFMVKKSKLWVRTNLLYFWPRSIPRVCKTCIDKRFAGQDVIPCPCPHDALEEDELADEPCQQGGLRQKHVVPDPGSEQALRKEKCVCKNQPYGCFETPVWDNLQASWVVWS